MGRCPVSCRSLARLLSAMVSPPNITRTRRGESSKYRVCGWSTPVSKLKVPLLRSPNGPLSTVSAIARILLSRRQNRHVRILRRLYHPGAARNEPVRDYQAGVLCGAPTPHLARWCCQPGSGGSHPSRPTPDSICARARRERRPNLTMRNPALAAILSAIIPGVGQLYNGRILAGILWLIITPGFWIGSGGTLGWICHVIAAYTAYTYARDNPVRY